jgi:phage repressor protein C with HTH and peptisase S24 domain
MHPSAQRLFEAVSSVTGRRLTLTEAAIAVGAKKAQTVKNWEERGVSRDGRLGALRAFGINPHWIETGTGEMLLSHRSEALLPGVPPVEVTLEENQEFPAIQKVRFKLSAGATGFAVEHIEDGSDPIVFRRQWFESRGYRPEKLFAVAVTNGSMEPTLFAGDLVVVNTEDTTLKDGAVVAANFEGEPVVKRMQRDEGQWWLASDNPDKRRYPRKLCTPEVKIIGRVVHKQSETI